VSALQACTLRRKTLLVYAFSASANDSSTAMLLLLCSYCCIRPAGPQTTRALASPPTLLTVCTCSNNFCICPHRQRIALPGAGEELCRALFVIAAHRCLELRLGGGGPGGAPSCQLSE
jgi:hypothetical protein